MRRLLAITDSGRLRDTLVRLPADWRIVVVTGVQEAAYRVGGEVSVVLVDLGEPERSASAAKEVLEHVGDVPAVLVVDHDEASVGFPVVTRSATAMTLDRLLGRFADVGLAAIGTGGDAPQRVGGAPVGDVPAEPDPQPDPDPELEPDPDPVVEAPDPVAEGPEPAPDPEVPVRERPAAPSAGGALRKRLRDRVASGISRASDAMASREEDAQPVDAQIDRARAALEQVTGLIAEMPALGAFQTVADALVAEIRDELAVDTVAVWSERDGGLAVVAGHGLTPAEARMRVGADQPVFSDLARNVDSVLLAPLDEARALVAGIAGARGDALMAASLEVDATPVAFVTVAAAHELTPKDLARLEAIAKEAAPGLALARALTRLQHGDGPVGSDDAELMATGDARG